MPSIHRPLPTTLCEEIRKLQHPWWSLSTILDLLDPRFRPQPSNLGINLGSNLGSNLGRKTEINGSPSPTSGLPHIRPRKSPLSLCRLETPYYIYIDTYACAHVFQHIYSMYMCSNIYIETVHVCVLSLYICWNTYI
jgi:hypothetical protein